MKIGDLVRLSAYGKKRRRTEWIDRDDVGIIIRLKSYPNGNWPDDFIVQWSRSPWAQSGRHYWHHEQTNSRRDLVYAK